eukprot:9489909-Pyramimonas_sp.AAC.1
MARCSDSSIDHFLLDHGPHAAGAGGTAETVPARGCTTSPGGDQHVVDEPVVQAVARPDVRFNIQFGLGQTTGEELEQLRFVMPLPLFQNEAHRQGADFFQTTLQKGNGLSMGEVGAHLRQWLWLRRDHRHVRAYVSTFLAML